MNRLEYAAFEAVEIAGNKILVCMPQNFTSKYDRESYVKVMSEIAGFIPDKMLQDAKINTRTIKLVNGSHIRIVTDRSEAMGERASELIFTHEKEDYDKDYIYTLLLCIEDKKHRRIIGI